MNIEIKQLTLNDIGVLIELRMEVLADVFKDNFKKLTNAEKENLKISNKNYYLNQLKTEDHIACVAYDNNKILGCGGMCLHNELPSTDNLNGKCASLMNIYVKPEYRKKGIGKKICNRLIELARHKDIQKLYEYYKQQGINTVFELNKGNHFTQTTVRMAKGIVWLLKNN